MYGLHPPPLPWWTINSLKEHIVKFIDFRPEPKPLLVMENLPLGSLEEQHAESPIAVEEMVVLMSQVLSALAYVHGVNVTHRDLKPGNFLVYSRWPFFVKLCDFGLAQDKSLLQTFCGSAQYLAPEVFDSLSYTNAVDMWSLAVILLEYVYGLPQMEKLPNPNKKKLPNPRRAVQEWGLGWCQRLVTAAEDWDSDPLIDFLTRYMLRLDPHYRLPAGDCLRRASELGLFDGAFSQTGHVTPKLQPVQVDETDQEDQSTVILSHLWEDDSSDVLLQEENVIHLLSTKQAASSTKDEPASIMSSIPQIDGSCKAKLSVGDITVSVRDPHASSPLKYRRTTKEDRIPSLPSLPPNAIDTCSSVDRLLGNYATNQTSPEHTHTRVDSRDGADKSLSSRRHSCREQSRTRVKTTPCSTVTKCECKAKSAVTGKILSCITATKGSD